MRREDLASINFPIHVAATFASLGFFIAVQSIQHVLTIQFAAGNLVTTLLAETVVGGVAMGIVCTELISGIALKWLRPSELPERLVLLGLGVLLAIWLSIGSSLRLLLEDLRAPYPRHLELQNVLYWVRVVLWGLRSFIVALMLRRLLRPDRPA